MRRRCRCQYNGEKKPWKMIQIAIVINNRIINGRTTKKQKKNRSTERDDVSKYLAKDDGRVIATVKINAF